MLPLPSAATPLGKSSLAAVATPPLPPKPCVPVPAMVEMFPVGTSTLRMRWLSRSAMWRLPEPSNATPTGILSLAAVAAPPSPSKPLVPDPATVEMIPVEASTLRTRWLKESAM